MTSEELPHLIVETTPIGDFSNPFIYVTHNNPTLWWRHNEGLVGVGEALRINYSGPERVAEAAADWRTLLAGATISNPLTTPGTGLVAFGTFTFSGESEKLSTIIVPRTVIGRRGGAAWVTQIRLAGEDADDTPQPQRAEPLGSEVRIHFSPGVMTPQRYQDTVAEALQIIDKSETLHKLVLARDVHAHFPIGADLRPILQSLALSYPECWVYSVDGLLGASPETLVAVSGGIASSRVLAGSAPRGRDRDSDNIAAVELALSLKEFTEHELAVRTVTEAFRDFATQVTASEYPSALKLPNLWHLASDVSGTLREDVTPLDAVAALHPTGAVAGVPRADAQQIVSQLEPFDRGRYSGPVGWVGSTGDSEWAVTIRAAQVESDGAVTAWAGCGVVPGSEPGQELAETKLKLRPILDAFG